MTHQTTVQGIGDKLDVKVIHASSGCELPEHIELVGRNSDDWKAGHIGNSNWIQTLVGKKAGDQVEFGVGDSDSVRIEILRVYRD